MIFKNRTDAGQRLAKALQAYAHRDDAIVLALPRGGVPIAFEISQTLGIPMDVLIVRKLGVPGHDELAMGAVASGGVLLLDPDITQRMLIPQETVEDVIDRATHEVQRREDIYRQGRLPLNLTHKTVILVDDGIATGASIRVAIASLLQKQIARLVVAVPVAPYSALEELEKMVDELVCLATPRPFFAVGQWYENFDELSDREVGDMIDRAWKPEPAKSLPSE